MLSLVWFGSLVLIAILKLLCGSWDILLTLQTNKHTHSHTGLNTVAFAGCWYKYHQSTQTFSFRNTTTITTSVFAIIIYICVLLAENRQKLQSNHVTDLWTGCYVTLFICYFVLIAITETTFVFFDRMETQRLSI